MAREDTNSTLIARPCADFPTTSIFYYYYIFNLKESKKLERCWLLSCLPRRQQH